MAPLFEKTDPEVVIMDQMTDYLTSFAKDSKPYTSRSNVVEWYPSSRYLLQTLYIDYVTAFGGGFSQQRFQIWDELFPVSDGASTINLSVLAMVVLPFLCFLR